MGTTDRYSGEERRGRDRSEGIQLRRRQRQLPDGADERRQSNTNGFDIAGALELHLDEVTTRRAMITLLESWLAESEKSAPSEREPDYVRAVQHAIEVMKAAPDVLTGIAILQRQDQT